MFKIKFSPFKIVLWMVKFWFWTSKFCVWKLKLRCTIGHFLFIGGNGLPYFSVLWFCLIFFCKLGNGPVRTSTGLKLFDVFLFLRWGRFRPDKVEFRLRILFYFSWIDHDLHNKIFTIIFKEITETREQVIPHLFKSFQYLKKIHIYELLYLQKHLFTSTQLTWLLFTAVVYSHRLVLFPPLGSLQLKLSTCTVFFCSRIKALNTGECTTFNAKL